MEAICFSEMLVDFQRTPRHCIPEDKLFSLYSFLLHSCSFPSRMCEIIFRLSYEGGCKWSVLV
jgi:hypothetical protein